MGKGDGKRSEWIYVEIELTKTGVMVHIQCLQRKKGKREQS